MTATAQSVILLIIGTYLDHFPDTFQVHEVAGVNLAAEYRILYPSKRVNNTILILTKKVGLTWVVRVLRIGATSSQPVFIGASPIIDR